MKIAAISDIHGNLEALEAVLEKIQETPHDVLVCLGDIVGYGANPNECVSLVKQHCDHVILGNHDRAVLAPDEQGFADFNHSAAQAMRWVRRECNDGTISYLKTLENSLTFSEGVKMVHGAPDGPDEYIFSDWDAEVLSRTLEEPVALFGHTHVATIHRTQSGKTLVNPGSVGQPRDRIKDARFVIVDLEQRRGSLLYGDYPVEDFVKWHRVPYDIVAAQRKIRAAGLPGKLADRLAEGR